MISFKDFTKLFSFDLEGKWCIEIEFSVKGYPKYQSCWMGKLPDKKILIRSFIGSVLLQTAPKDTDTIIS